LSIHRVEQPKFSVFPFSENFPAARSLPICCTCRGNYEFDGYYSNNHLRNDSEQQPGEEEAKGFDAIVKIHLRSFAFVSRQIEIYVDLLSAWRAREPSKRQQ
jgi:hypothetical protein